MAKLGKMKNIKAQVGRCFFRLMVERLLGKGFSKGNFP
jgi:hypothetical protein